MSALLAGLYALRAQVDALILQVEAGQPAPPCTHEETEDAGSTLGNNVRRRCVKCGEVVVR